MRFYNTVQETPADKAEFEKITDSQDKMILNVIKQHAKPLTCWDIYDYLQIQGTPILITSIRRSLNTLELNLQITFYGKKRGPFGRNVTAYY